MTGRFITLEGGEGSGKSTQAVILEEALKRQGIAVTRTREPGGTEGAEAIRTLLLHGENYRWDAATETLLFMAARRDHVEKVIRPALIKGNWVICDRFLDSTIVYQGAAQSLNSSYIQTLYHMAVGNLSQDLTLILDVPPETGLARAESRPSTLHDRFESREIEFHQKLREGFLSLAAATPSRYAVINAKQSKESVAAEIWDIISTRLQT